MFWFPFCTSGFCLLSRGTECNNHLNQNQLERHENIMLRQENDKLRVENVAIKEAVRNPICNHCGGVAILGNITIEENRLRIENTQLREELSRICGLAEKFLGRPVTPLRSPLAPQRPSSNLEFEVSRNGFSGLSLGGNPLPMGPLTRPGMMAVEKPFNSSMFVELAVIAMDELLRLAQADCPIWMTSLDGGKETLNPVEYMRAFSPCIGLKPSGFVSEASRETGMVMINSLALVETLMDAVSYSIALNNYCSIYLVVITACVQFLSLIWDPQPYFSLIKGSHSFLKHDSNQLLVICNPLYKI